MNGIIFRGLKTNKLKNLDEISKITKFKDMIISLLKLK